MKRIALGLALLSLLALGGSAFAEIGTIDEVPAATLLVPYFEVDLSSATGITTLFSINNASASAAVAHVTFWTDMSIPTLDFDVYLTGYDVQTINIRDIFAGTLPRTADAGADPNGSSIGVGISPRGSLSQDINFPGSSGPCAAPYVGVGTLTGSFINQHLIPAHTGNADTLFSAGRCLGAKYSDSPNIARGYVTIDSVTSCNTSFPSDAGYFTTLADNRNILWGDVFYVNPAENFASGNAIVHIESCISGSAAPGYNGYVGNGAGNCPFVPGDYTFYGRYAAVAGQDQREPLASTFATRYAQGGAFNGGTDLLVWRDSKTIPSGANGPFVCSAGGPSWFPLAQTDVVSFDEAEQPTNLCFSTGDVSPLPVGSQACFPLETQRIHLAGGNEIGDDPTPPTPFGWMYINLNHTIAGDPFPGRAQNWVMVQMSAEGRYEVGYDAIQLDNLTQTVAPGVVLIP